jgi:hypothetical protein
VSSPWSKLLISELELTLQTPSLQTGTQIFLIMFLSNIRKAFSSDQY